MISSPEEFYKLRTSRIPEEYERAAREEAPLEVWRAVIKRYRSMRFWVAHNKTVPIEILEILASDADPRVRHMVASKNKLPLHLQTMLAGDQDAGIRCTVARNRGVKPEILRLLAQDPDEMVQRIARQKSNRTGKDE